MMEQEDRGTLPRTSAHAASMRQNANPSDAEERRVAGGSKEDLLSALLINGGFKGGD
jgi:hypothetical protein